MMMVLIGRRHDVLGCFVVVVVAIVVVVVVVADADERCLRTTME